MQQDFSRPGAYILEGPQDWQIFQRNADGTADITLSGVWTPEGPPCVVEARVAREDTGAPPSVDCDWRDAEMLPDRRWRITITGVPTGGLYMIDTRLRQEGDPWRLTGDKIFHVAVGDLWIIAGQSNAAGYGHGPVEDPPALCVHVFGADLAWKLAMHPLHDTTRTTHPVNRDQGYVGVSPWLSFARQVYQETAVPIGLLPTALGGSPLSMWDPASDNHVLYDNMLATVRSAGGSAAGMLWYQGESDAGPELIDTYAERFTRFVEETRKELRRPHMPVLTAQLNRVEQPAGTPLSRWWCMMREVQRQIAKTLPNVAVLPTLDLGLSDGIHTSATGNVILGQRFAQAALALAYGRKVPYLAPEIARASFGGSRDQILLEFDNVCGWLAPHKIPITEFSVEDADGFIGITNTDVSGSTVKLTLERPAGPDARVHGALSPDPLIGLLDQDGRPILGFCDVRVEESMKKA